MNKLPLEGAKLSVVKTPQYVVESQCRAKLNNSKVKPS